MFIVGSAERGRVRQRISFRGAFITEHEPSRKQAAVPTFCNNTSCGPEDLQPFVQHRVGV